MKKVWDYLWPVLLCVGVGVTAGFFQRSAIEEWYPLLHKPSITPPAIVFPIVWSILYVLMGLSLSFLIKRKSAKWLIAVWGAQLFFNFLWSILFFSWRSPYWDCWIFCCSIFSSFSIYAKPMYLAAYHRGCLSRIYCGCFWQHISMYISVFIIRKFIV